MATEKCNKCRKPVPRISLDVAGVCRSCRRPHEDASQVKFGEDTSGFSSMTFDSDSGSSSSNDSSSSDSSSSDFSGGGGDFGGGGSSGEW